MFGGLLSGAKTVHCRTGSLETELLPPGCILPWDRRAVDVTTVIKMLLSTAGTPIGPNDTAITGNAIAVGAILVTNNMREFKRVPGITLED